MRTNSGERVKVSVGGEVGRGGCGMTHTGAWQNIGQNV